MRSGGPLVVSFLRTPLLAIMGVDAMRRVSGLSGGLKVDVALVRRVDVVSMCLCRKCQACRVR
jgi:hypothetical protein